MNTAKISSFLVTASVVLGGCGAPNRARDIGMAIDGSGSAKPFVKQYARIARRVAATLPPSGRIVVYRYAMSCQELYDGPKPKSGDSFQTSLVSAIEGREKVGTSPASAIAALASAAEKADKPFLGEMLTDGGNDDFRPNAAAEIRSAAERLAKAPHFEKLIIAGALPGTREELRANLGALVGKLEFVELDRAVEVMR